MKGTYRFLLALLSVVGLALFAPGAVRAEAGSGKAESETGGGLEEVIVTATRREANVQDVPIAISAISGDSLRDSGIVDPRQLTGLAPNLYVDQGLTNGMTHVSIRGLASTDFSLGASSPVATYIDDIFQPFQFGLATQVYDLNRIEVLRGPQGTLFGKNATGGALSYYAQTPTRNREGYLQVDGGGGDFTHYDMEGAFNTPLTDALAMRISARIERRNDYVANLYDGSELGHYTNVSGRVQFAWTPSAATRVNLKLFGLKNRGDGPVYIGHYQGGECDPVAFLDIYNKCVDGVAAPDSPDSRRTSSDVPIKEDYDNYGATLKVDHDLRVGTLTSITGWQKGSIDVLTNDDGIAGDLFHSRQQSDTSQVSQELRFATDAAARVRAIVGAFGQYDKITADQGSASTTIDPATGFQYYTGSIDTQKTTTLAAFTSITADVAKNFSVIGGLRYSYERKTTDNHTVNLFGFNFENFSIRDFTNVPLAFSTMVATFPVDANFGDLEEFDVIAKNWNKLTWDLTFNYRPGADSLVYAKLATGFRSGGFPVGSAQVGTFTTVRPETVTSYELGFKSEWINHLLRVNGAVYTMDYKDMQVQTVNTTGPGLVLSNAASARAKGAELEVEAALTRGLHFKGGVGYSDATYKRYLSRFGPLDGNRLPYAPEWSGTLSGSYEARVSDRNSIEIGTDWSYRSEVFFDPYNTPNVNDRSRFMGDARISYGAFSDKGWRVTAYVNNLTNQDVRAFAYTIGYAVPSIYAPKRTWGLRAETEF